MNQSFFYETREWLKDVAPFLGESVADEFFRRFAQDAREVYCSVGFHGGDCEDTSRYWNKGWVDTSESARHYVYDDRPDMFCESIYDQFRRLKQTYCCYEEGQTRFFYRMTFWIKAHSEEGTWMPIPLKTYDVEFLPKTWEIIGITEVPDGVL